MENWIQYFSMHPWLGVLLGIFLLSAAVFIIKKLVKIALIIVLILAIGLLFTYRKSQSNEFLEKIQNKSEEVKEKVMEKGQEKMDEAKDKAVEEGKEALKESME